MTRLLARMRAALQTLPTWETAPNFPKPAGLILQGLLAAQTRFLDEEWAFWARYIVRVAVMLNLGMSAWPWPGAVKATLRGVSPTWLWRVQDSPSTRTAYLLEDGLQTGRTRPFVTQLLTIVLSTFQQPSAHPGAEVLVLNILVERSQFLLAPRRLPLGCLLLSWTAVLTTLMTPTAQLGPASSKAFWLLNITLMTMGLNRRSPAPT